MNAAEIYTWATGLYESQRTRKLAALENSLAEAIASAKEADRALGKLPGRAPLDEPTEAELEAEWEASAAWDAVSDVRGRIERHRALEHGVDTVFLDRANGNSQQYVVPAGYDGDPVGWGQ